MQSHFRRPAILLAFLLAIAGALLGCGGGTRTVTVTKPNAPLTAAVPQRDVSKACPADQSQMGCSVLPTPSTTATKPLLFSLAAPMFPDVSVWQGTVGWPSVANWQRSHGWPSGGIFKMGEFSVDNQASNNSLGTKNLTWRAGYWFVRNTGCTHEADQIKFYAQQFGLKIVVLDLEVREAAGYGLCLSPPLRAAGLVVVEYTAPGTNPGGADTHDPLWEATYGSSFRAIWSPVVAWQCTDGSFGCVTYIPGIGRDDVSYDLGISKLAGPPPPPPDPFADMDHTLRHFGHGVNAREYDTVKTWAQHKCLNPVRRQVCVFSLGHLQLLSGRLWHVAHNPLHHGHATWNLDHRGERFKIMWNDEHQVKK